MLIQCTSSDPANRDALIESTWARNLGLLPESPNPLAILMAYQIRLMKENRIEWTDESKPASLISNQIPLHFDLILR